MSQGLGFGESGVVPASAAISELLMEEDEKQAKLTALFLAKKGGNFRVLKRQGGEKIQAKEARELRADENEEESKVADAFIVQRFQIPWDERNESTN